MATIIGVRFRTAGKVYYFDPGEFEINVRDKVIVETARGVEIGETVSGRAEVEEDQLVQPLKGVLRIATQDDIARDEDNRRKEKEAFKICQEKIRKHELEMKLIGCEYTLDNNKLLFYFTADGRIDFRELVKDLASVFKTRIELRQVGVRDETKMRGGIGICGRPLCCATYLSDFSPVSIKMAKEQNLSLNPTKISGVCGRLMCCLTNEEETYEYLNSKLPAMGEYVTTPEGLSGKVTYLNVLRQRVKVTVDLENDEKELREYSPEELKFKPRKKKDKKDDKDKKKRSGFGDLDGIEETPEELAEELAAELTEDLEEELDEETKEELLEELIEELDVNRSEKKESGMPGMLVVESEESAEEEDAISALEEEFENSGKKENRNRRHRNRQKSRSHDGNGEHGDGEDQNHEGHRHHDRQHRDGQRRDGQRRDGQNRDGQKNRDGQRNRDGQHRDGQRRDGQQRDGQNRDGQHRDGQRRDGQKREGQNREGQNREGQGNRNRHRNRGHHKNNGGQGNQKQTTDE